MSSKRNAFTCLIRICIAVGLLEGNMALANPPQNRHSLSAPVVLNFRKVSLMDALKSLSDQIGRSILIDGEPRRRETTIDFSGDGSGALDRVADAFDCTWEEGKHDVILMRKRFSKPEDMPQFNRVEWLQVTRNVLDSLNTLNFDHDLHLQTVDATRLYRSLTNEQLQLLQGKQRLTLAQISVAQQELARQWIFNAFFADSYSKWQRLEENLRAMPTSRLEQRVVNLPWEELFYNRFRIGQPATGMNRCISCMYVSSENDNVQRSQSLAVVVAPTENKP